MTQPPPKEAASVTATRRLRHEVPALGRGGSRRHRSAWSVC